MKAPVSELLALMEERGIGQAVRDRVGRLNAGGYDPGLRVRGWHPAPTLWSAQVSRQLASRWDYDARHGQGAFDQLPRCLLTDLGGKRRAVSWFVLAATPEYLAGLICDRPNCRRCRPRGQA